MTIGKSETDIAIESLKSIYKPRFSNVPLSALKKNKSANESFFNFFFKIKSNSWDFLESQFNIKGVEWKKCR